MKFHLLLVPLFLSLLFSMQDLSSDQRLAIDHPQIIQTTNNCAAGGSQLYINEFMADNAYSHSDEEGQYDDWLEIYNAGSGSVYLGDKFLSDDHSTPNKWPMPDISIGAGEYLVFWCDEDQSQGVLHTNFKLSSGGEQLGIWDSEANDLMPIDTFTYGEVGDDMPWGLYPDGSGEIMPLSWRTPGASNVPLSTENAKAINIDVFPNPVSDQLNIDATFAITSIEIISIDGKSWRIEGLDQQNRKIDFSNFAAGIYTVRVSGKEQMEQVKIVKP